jgi:predicted nucleic acid-binding protein
MPYGYIAAIAAIAAIASAKGFMVATRDTSPFEAAGVPTINPWDPQS